MNVILKSFDGHELDPVILERAFRGVKLGTCVHILNEEKWMPKLDARENIWVPAGPLRAGEYPGVDWNTITPLDEELVESMRHSEAVFYTMVERYAKKREISYAERKRMYGQHLRYWNHILVTKRIDLLLLYHVPHQCYDYVLYNLCKVKGIPTLHLELFGIIDACTVVDDWRESGKEILGRFQELAQRYGDPAEPVPLSANYERYFTSFREEKPEPWFMQTSEKYLQPKSFFRKWHAKAWDLLRRKPREFLRASFSPDTWSRKLRQHRTTQMYFQNQRMPDLEKPYVYLPLHAQPEMSTCPMAGVFVDQERIVQLLAATLPPNVRIYVKEHPLQGELCRSEAFYRTLLAIPSVTLVPKDMDTFQLIENAIAVATATGTPAFQALFRQKPVLMFGHRFFQYAPGVHGIRTAEDCRNAAERIFVQRERPALRDLRIFLKAVEECAVPYTGVPHSPRETLTQEEKAEGMGAKIAEKLRPLLDHVEP